MTGEPLFTNNPRTPDNNFGFLSLNPAAFAAPPSYEAAPPVAITDPAYREYYANPMRFFGTASPVLYRCDGRPFYSENLSVLKKTRITETVTLELGVEAFNPFNRHRF
ncbi:MAG: hypothetical protein H0T63_09370 [Pyrinomonadaceae bacterium]|nr:hypothetical protein [Pyrinomonadaceae bacterium]